MSAPSLPAELAAELEQKFFWWEPVGEAPRSQARILAQAMSFASFEDVRRLEQALGADRLADAMVTAEPGWIDERSWEFWRGRLMHATGRAIPDAPPRRSLGAATIQEDENTLVVNAAMPSGAVKVSLFGGMTIGRINEPLRTRDQTLLVASLEDLLATKLKAILDRAEAKDYRDIAAMLSAGVALERGLGGFAKMFRSDAALPLKALGFFKDGDLPTLSQSDRDMLCRARDGLSRFGQVDLRRG